MAQEHPTAAAMASYTRSRLPFARPQTLQNPPKPSQPSNSPASSARKRYPNKPNTRHSRTQKPPQGHSNGSRAPHGRSNGFLYAFKAAVCQASNAPKPSKNPPNPPKVQLRKEKVPQQAQHAPLPHAKATTRPQQWLKSTPHGRSNGFLYAFKAAVCQASNAPKPSKTLQTLQKSALQTLQKSGQLRKEKVPQQAQHAPLPHAKATTRPQQWLKSTPRPQQWLLIRVQGCRLPGLKRSKTLQTLQTLQKSGQLRREKVPQQAQHAPLPHAKATTRPQQWLKGTPRPQQWLLIRVQGCRLPGLKRSKTLQTLQKSGQLRKEKVPQQAQHAPLPHAKATTRPQQWLKGTPRPQQWLLIRVQGCRLPGLKRSKTLQTLQKSGQLRKEKGYPARKRYPNKPNTRHSRTQKPPQGHSNGSRAPHGRSNGFLYAFKAAVCQASNAPKPSKTLQTLQKSGQLRREKVPQQAQHAPLPHAKATTRPQQWLKGTPRPQQWLLIRVQGCRLPGLKRSKPFKPSKPSKSPPSSAGKRYPNKPNTRHSRTQKPPQGHSNGSRAPHGRSNGFL